MFGTNKYKKIKSKRFNTNNERKKYFAIVNYYKNKNPSITIYSKPTNNKVKKK